MVWLGEMDTEMPVPGSEEGGEEYWMKWMREVEETGSEEDMVKEERRKEGGGETDRKEREDRDRPCTMKPLISSLKRLTSQDTNTPPPPGVMMIVWLPPKLSQDPIPAAVTGRHLMRMESDDNGGSEAEETRAASTTPEMGIIFPGTK
jgi:hypothetical protein